MYKTKEKRTQQKPNAKAGHNNAHVLLVFGNMVKRWIYVVVGVVPVM